ncbi:ribbon-helix-helix domain-containing protein [Haloprofundus salilacus]|uniref:ribbon-helix-helix domain-containing protein n=1 Tax=Haloprofundus salilacus TaxID=2876190 RepID=UPI001CC96F2B|nr:ribbon-helix-helix domain-containing protein [Haloprofundus salilacus]
MAKISVEVPDELLADLDEHVGDDRKFVNRSDAIRASIRKTLDLLDEIDDRHGRLEDEKTDASASDETRNDRA